MTENKAAVDPHSQLRKRLQGLLNKECAENGSDTPDFILAQYLIASLKAFDWATAARDKWYSVCLEPAHAHFEPGHYSAEPLVEALQSLHGDCQAHGILSKEEDARIADIIARATIPEEEK